MAGHKATGRMPGKSGQLRRGALRLAGAALWLPTCPARTQSAPAQCFKSAHVCGFWAAPGRSAALPLYFDSPGRSACRAAPWA